VDTWDEEEYTYMGRGGLPKDPKENEERKNRENYHRKVLEELDFLVGHFFSQYELNKPRPFIDVLLDWLGQFEGRIGNQEGDDASSSLNLEQRYAFILARKILFFNRNQMISLLIEVWGNIKKELLRIASERLSLSVSELIFRIDSINDELDKSLFTPLSDSSHFMEFRHHCIPEGRSDVLMPCMDRLLLPVDIRATQFIKKMKERYRHKSSLFIIEDFSGSGGTAEGKIKKIIDNYHFRNIYFCPLIVTDMARKVLENLIPYAGENKINFRVLGGIVLGDEYSVAYTESDRIWNPEEREAITKISKKYFNTHFRRNAYLYRDYKNPEPSQSTPLGFRNCGLPLVLYSNCPNNSLPIIWADDNGWKPLFRRHDRHVLNLAESEGQFD
jgi:hypothetical protein